MKKHLNVVVTLVALVTLVNGLSGGAGGRSTGAGRGGVPRSTSSAGSSQKSSKSHGGTGVPGSDNAPLSRNSTLAGRSEDARAGAPERLSDGPSGTAGRQPGSSSSRSGISNGISDLGEGPNRPSGAGRSRGTTNIGRGGPAERTPPPGSFGRIPGIGSAREGSRSRLVGVGGGGANVVEGLGIDGERFSGGYGFSRSFGETGDKNEDEEDAFFATGSSRSSSGFGRGGRNSGFGADAIGFGAFGSPIEVPSLGGYNQADGASSSGRRRPGVDEMFQQGPGFSTPFGTTSGFNRSPGSGFVNTGFSNRRSGPGQDFGEGRFGSNWNGEAGLFGRSTPGFYAFSNDGNTDFAGPGGGVAFPAGLAERPGSNAGISDGEHEALTGWSPQQGLGRFPGSGNEPDGSAGWPSRQRFDEFESSGFDSSRGLTSPPANVPGRSGRIVLLQRLWQRRPVAGHSQFGMRRHLRKPDPRGTAAVILGTLAGAAAIGGLGARVAAAIHERRQQGGFGRRPRVCLGRCCSRQRQLDEGIKVADNIFRRIPGGIERLY